MPILIDTNVASEFMRPRNKVNDNVWTWFNDTDLSTVRLCRIVDAEVKFGAYAHRDAVQMSRLVAGWEKLVARFEMLEYSPAAAENTARLRALERRRGRQVSFPDAAIAGIALANNCALATRNTKDFEGSDLILINPFEPSPGEKSS